MKSKLNGSHLDSESFSQPLIFQTFLINTNAVLAFAVALEGFETVLGQVRGRGEEVFLLYLAPAKWALPFAAQISPRKPIWSVWSVR